MNVYRFALGFFMLVLCTPCVYGNSVTKKGYALVVTNNRSLSLERPDLHYADDDGIKYAQLFSEFLGKENVVLLTEADAATMRLYPRWGASARTPTLVNLMREVAGLKKRIAVDRSTGRKVQLYLVFAGHGDLDHGQGFIELADGRLTSQRLESEVIVPLKTDRVHLILDSCNSFFMLNPRGGTARRWATSRDASNNMLDKYPYLGALISTSSEAVTYEWSELQSGIFSYAVRSGLRGAADADGKVGLSYAELEAFISVATAAIKNELYRPKVFARGPGGNAQALFVSSLPGNVVLTVPEKGTRRLTVRDSEGVRVLDIHKEDGTAVRLGLPANGEVLQVYESVQFQGTPRPQVLVGNLSFDRRDILLDDIAFLPTSYAMRGESPVFRTMFKQQYGKIAFNEFFKSLNEQKKFVYGVSKQQMALLQTHLGLAAQMERTNVVRSSVLGMAVGVVYSAVGLGILLNQSNGVSSTEGKLTLGVGMMTLTGHAYRLITPTILEKIYGEFLKNIDDDTESRELAFVQTESRWQQVAEKARKQRRISGTISTILGSALTLGAAIYIPFVPRVEDDPDVRKEDYVVVGAVGGIGLLTIGVGIWWLTHPAPVEEVYDMYLDSSAKYRATDATVKLNAIPVAFHNGGGLVLVGIF